MLVNCTKTKHVLTGELIDYFVYYVWRLEKYLLS